MPLIFTFMLMFASFNELSRLIPTAVLDHVLLSPISTYLFSIGLSQLISNVPATLIIENHVNNWIPLAVGTNVGGCGVITGSLANLITIRLTRCCLSEFHRYALPIFLMITVLNSILIVFLT